MDGFTHNAQGGEDENHSQDHAGTVRRQVNNTSGQTEAKSTLYWLQVIVLKP